jgi:hypothetical protein
MKHEKTVDIWKFCATISVGFMIIIILISKEKRFTMFVNPRSLGWTFLEEAE